MFKNYFPHLTEQQNRQFEQLYNLYAGWNAKINVVSRKDIENLNIRHVLHSLGIAEVVNFKENTTVMDVGTGGGFPGIPLAIMFPETHFHLIDRIGKKIKVANEVAQAIGLENVTFQHGSAEEVKTQFDFIVSRSVMSLADLVKIVKKNIRKKQSNAIPNGLICLKGGELQHEIFPFKRIVEVYELSHYFNEEYFKTKKIIYLPL